MVTTLSASEICLTVTKVHFYRIARNGAVRGPVPPGTHTITCRRMVLAGDKRRHHHSDNRENLPDRAHLALEIMRECTEGYDFHRIDVVEDGWAVAKHPSVKVTVNSEECTITVERDLHAYYAGVSGTRRQFDLSDPDSLRQVREQLNRIFSRK